MRTADRNGNVSFRLVIVRTVVMKVLAIHFARRCFERKRFEHGSTFMGNSRKNDQRNKLPAYAIKNRKMAGGKRGDIGDRTRVWKS